MYTNNYAQYDTCNEFKINTSSSINNFSNGLIISLLSYIKRLHTHMHVIKPFWQIWMH